MNGDRRCMVHPLFAETVGQPGKAPHLNPHGQILALNEGGRNVLRVRLSDKLLSLSGPIAIGRSVSEGQHSNRR